MKNHLFLLLLILNCVGLSAQNVDFKHNWDMKYLKNGIQFTSILTAPLQYSEIGEPQAVMIVTTDSLNNKTNTELDKLIIRQTLGLRKSMIIDKYIDKDYVPLDDIVTYYSKVGDCRIGVLKYRFSGVNGEKLKMPRTSRQIFFFLNNKLWISTLMVIYDKDIENMFKDQMTFIENSIINQH